MLRTVILFALAALLCAPALAADVAIKSIEVGFDGTYKAGRLTPLVVRVETGSSPPAEVVVETVTADAEGSAAIRFSDALPIGDGGSENALVSVFQAGRLGSDLTVRLRTTDGSLLAERRLRSGSAGLPLALDRTKWLWVVADELNSASGDTDDGGIPLPSGVVGASLNSPLPVDEAAYASVDVLIVRGDLAPSAAESEAIRKWVAGGGHLAVALGRFTDQYRSGPIAEWIPIEVGETVQVRDLSPLETYAGSQRRLPARVRVRAARLGNATELLPQGAETPIIARSVYGFGRVTLFAIDLDDFPFANWSGLPRLIERALSDGKTTGGGRTVATPGLSELGTQLFRSQESLFGVERPTVGTALILLLIYAFIVGLVDYLLVHRVLKRPALTWVTLPVLIALAVWWLHDRAIAANGTESRFNELHLLDVDAASGTTRGRTVVTAYAADPVRADVTIAPQVGVASGEATGTRGLRLTWVAPFEETFGGTFREASGGLFRPEYVMQPPAREAAATDVPFLVWSARSFETRWLGDTGGELVEADLISRGEGRLEGSLRHHFPVPITDFVIAFGNRVFMPRESEWHPGDAIELGSGAFQANDLISFLTRRRVERRDDLKPGAGGSDFIVTETAYDPLATNPDAVMQMLTFHTAAGGPGYTGLANTVLSRDDLTPLLRMGRAVLLGRIDAPAASVTAAAGDTTPFALSRRTSYVRFVLPTTKAEVEPVRVLPPARPN